MGWFERKMRQRRKRLRYFGRLLGERTPEQIAENRQASDLAEQIPTGDAAKLAQDIGELDESDRYLLACRAEGKSQREIASQLWLDEQTVKLELARIVKSLRADA